MYNNIKSIHHNNVFPDMIGKPYLLAETSLRTTDWGEHFQFLDNTELGNTVFNNTILDEIHPSVFSCKNLLSKSQCKKIITKAEKLNFQLCCYGEERNNSRLVLFDENFADFLWKNLSEQFVDKLGDNPVHPFGFDASRGNWKLSGINQAMRLNRYSGKNKEFFGPHRDAPFCPNGDKRSLYTMLIYLNDDFEGGQTILHFPKNISTDTKGQTISKEIQFHGNIFHGFDHISIKPQTGTCLIFKQNILHQGYPLHSESTNYKYIIKTDIMVERPVKLGFSPPVAELQDYFECLQLFREAQQCELAENTARANDCYEKSLSIRYNYPKEEQFEENLPRQHRDFSDVAAPDKDNNSMEAIENLSLPNIFSKEIWLKIMKYIVDIKSLNNLCKVFPFLKSEKKKLFFDRVVPETIYSSGVYTNFSISQNVNFVNNNMNEFAKVAAVYSMCLLGNAPNDKHYLVNYDRETRSATTVQLRDLLYGVFAEEPVHGTIFKVAQRKKEKDPNKDLYHSVDRNYMAKYFDRDDIGIDMQSEFRSKITILSETGDGDDRDNLFVDLPLAVRDLEVRNMLNSYDRYYEYCKNELPRDEPHDELYEKGARDFKLITYSEDDGFYPDDQVECNKGDLDCYKDRDKESVVWRSNIYDDSDGEDFSFQKIEKQKLVDENITIQKDCFPGAAIIRKMNEPTKISKEDGYCTCFMFQHLGGKHSKNCSSHVFNHLVADFSKIKLKVFPITIDDFFSRKLKAWAEYFCPCDDYDYKTFSVNICPMSDVIKPFNHAACQCCTPDYQIDDYVTLSNYPMLSKIIVFFAQHKEDSSKVNMFTVYSGIVTL
eukprot:TCONS_00062465-protein